MQQIKKQFATDVTIVYILCDTYIYVISIFIMHTCVYNPLYVIKTNSMYFNMQY